jgi:hypothetical protein
MAKPIFIANIKAKYQSLAINRLIARPNSLIQPPVETMMATRTVISRINRRMLLANRVQLSADDLAEQNVPAALPDHGWSWRLAGSCRRSLVDGAVVCRASSSRS